MAWLYVVVVGAYLIQACMDGVAAGLVLFYPGADKVDVCEVVVDDDSAENPAPKNSGGGLAWLKETIVDFYLSIFNDLGCSDERHNAAFKRMLMYWVSAMSLVRVVAIGFPGAPTFIAVAAMYTLEGLVFEFEGFTHKTVKPESARKISMFCLGMCAVSCVMAILA